MMNSVGTQSRLKESWTRAIDRRAGGREMKHACTCRWTITCEPMAAVPNSFRSVLRRLAGYDVQVLTNLSPFRQRASLSPPEGSQSKELMIAATTARASAKSGSMAKAFSAAARAYSDSIRFQGQYSCGQFDSCLPRTSALIEKLGAR